MVIELLKTLVFGIVEGITEWLPISSTGHLILLDEFLSLKASDNFKEMFDVVIQLGAILAVVVIYWKKLWPFGRENNPKPLTTSGFGACVKKDILQMWCKVIVATVPAAVIGLLLDDWSQAHLYNAWTVAIMLILFGVAFIWIEKWHKNQKPKMNSIGALRYSTVLIHFLSGDSGNVRGKPAEAGEVRSAFYRHGNGDAADRYDLCVCGFHRGDSFPDELHQEA